MVSEPNLRAADVSGHDCAILPTVGQLGTNPMGIAHHYDKMTESSRAKGSLATDWQTEFGSTCRKRRPKKAICCFRNPAPSFPLDELWHPRCATVTVAQWRISTLNLPVEERNDRRNHGRKE